MTQTGDALPAFFGVACGAFFLLIFAGIGAFLIYKYYQGKKKAEASQSWPSTVGTITDVDVRRNSSTDSDGHVSYTYTPMVTYTYQLMGQAYTSSQISFGMSRGYGSQAKAEAELNAFPVGKQVTVYYDPGKPQDAVLERSNRGSTVALVVGIIFVALSVCLGCPILTVVMVNTFSNL